MPSIHSCFAEWTSEGECYDGEGRTRKRSEISFGPWHHGEVTHDRPPLRHQEVHAAAVPRNQTLLWCVACWKRCEKVILHSRTRWPVCLLCFLNMYAVQQLVCWLNLLHQGNYESMLKSVCRHIQALSAYNISLHTSCQGCYFSARIMICTCADPSYMQQ